MCLLSLWGVILSYDRVQYLKLNKKLKEKECEQRQNDSKAQVIICQVSECFDYKSSPGDDDDENYRSLK